jgi:hypothetical protein
MYRLSRILQMLGVVSGTYAIALLIAMGWPGTAWLVGLFVLVRVMRSDKHQLTTLGSARWADEEDLRSAGMIGADHGLVLGRLPKRLRRGRSDLRLLFDRQVSSKEACPSFLWEK